MVSCQSFEEEEQEEQRSLEYQNIENIEKKQHVSSITKDEDREYEISYLEDRGTSDN